MGVPYWSPAVTYGASQRLWLPPWIEARTRQGQELGIANPARAERALITSIAPNQGVELELRIPDYLTDPVAQGTALAWLRDIWTALSGREFTLSLFSTSGWEDCALVEWSNSIGLDPFVRVRGSLRIFCPHPIDSLSAGISWSDSTDYLDNYPFASVVGLPLGTVPDTTPAALVPVMHYQSGTFHGKLAGITALGSEFTFEVPGNGTDSYQVTAVQITHAQDFLADGNTTVVVSDGPVGDGDSESIAATVASDEKRSAAGSGTFTVPGGSTLYAFVSIAGDHSDVQFQFAVQPV